MAKDSKKQGLVVIVSACVVIALSTLVTLYYSGALTVGEGDKGYQNVTFTDAALSCEEEAKSEFDDDLARLIVDNHSSRFELEGNLYKIFLNADVRKSKNNTVLFYVTCYVRAGNGRIAKFEMLEDKDAPRGEAITKNREKFIQWPR